MKHVANFYSGPVSKTAGWMLFLIGLFTFTRINLGGSIAISELFMFLAMPFVIAREWPHIRARRMTTIFVLCLLWCMGALLADWHNNTYYLYALKGIATPVVIFSCMVCLFALLRRDILGFRWLLLGLACSYVLSTFVFSRAASIGVEELGQDAFERTVGYKLYWVTMFSHWVLLPTKGWYLKVPFFYGFISVLSAVILNLVKGARSMFVSSLISLILLLIAHKSRRAMTIFRKHFFVFCLVLFACAIVSKKSYQYCVTHGMLGEEEQKKYERQSARGAGVLNMLMAGRVEFFVSSYAALCNPIVGYGSWALDNEGLYPEFIHKYGTEEDLSRYQMVIMRNGNLVRVIPFHSHIITYWMWHGVLGLLFFVYVWWLVFSTFKNRMGTIPALYGYFVLTIPSFMWDLFFSPLGNRVEEATLFVLCLLVRNYENSSHTGSH